MLRPRVFAWICACLLVVAGIGIPAAARAQSPPQITAVTPSVALPGQTLTITGQGFDWQISAPDINDVVLLGNVACPILSWSTTQITVAVPKDATSGNLVVTADNGSSNPVPVAVGPRGLYVLNAAGGVHPLFGAAPYAGPTPSGPAVAIAATPDGMGYWVLESSGQLLAYGDALPLSPQGTVPAPAVGLAVEPNGQGGWILSQNGTVTPVGQAPALGNAPGPAVAIAAAPNGQGYWVLEQNGTVVGFGSAEGGGEAGPNPVALAADPQGGLWVLNADGSVVGLDGAPTFGNLTAAVSAASLQPAAIAPAPDGQGYYILTAQGYLYGFGDAVVPNPLPPLPNNAPASVALAVVGPYHPYGLNDFVYWYPTGDLNQYLQYQSTMGQALNIISPHWFWVNGDGTVGGPTQDITPLVAEMQAHGLKVVPMFGRSFDGSLGPLATPQGQETIVQGILADVNQYHLNGVNIDFEGLPSQSAGYLDAFAQKLKAALGPNRMLAIDVYPDWAAYTDSHGNPEPAYVDTEYDYHFLSQVGYLVVMAYPMSWDPGPLSSLVKDSAIIDYILHGVNGSGPVANPDHVFFGVPGYAKAWEGVSGYGSLPSTTVPAITQTLAQQGVSPQYNPTYGETEAQYTVPFTVPQATLQSGSTGTGVVALQYALNTLLANPSQYRASSTAGSLPSNFPLTLDGDYGPSTVQAVYAFQIDWGVQGDPAGVYGPNTQSKLQWIASNTDAFSSGGIPAVTWYEDARGNLAHAQQIQSSGLSGIALWSMGEADPNYFSTLAEGVHLAANGEVTVTADPATLYQGVTETVRFTVTQGHGFPIANLTVSFLGETATTDGNGVAAFTVTPTATGGATATVTDPAGETVATTTVTVAAPSVARLGGQDRFGTAELLSNLWVGQSQTVVLATADNYPDALAGAPLAFAQNAPILLTDPNVLTPSTLAEIERLGAKRAILLGGPDAISDNVAQALEAAGIQVTRYAGQDRFGTAAAIAEALGDPSGVAVMASGQSYPDSLTIAPIAAENHWPLLLAGSAAGPGTLSPATTAAITALNIHTIYLIGSVNSIPQSVATALSGMGVTVERLSGGTDFYGTNLAVLNAFASRLDFTHLMVATGENFPDALTAGPAAAALGTAILLVPGSASTLPAAQSAFLAAHAANIGNPIVAGGPAAVSPGIAAALASLLP
ncbi:MAG: cell wall-binding repeat-containing protein [Firmicutes bacterium]|nr:cell wall-binding repeat-containing protein [Alicyclobacillaceae bacterium]MCL6498160.1 cell wall-binding repeat-containing protein [Bacillota bacterium]